ncbi:hypothetical protein B0H13DRAFT_2317833 [Mycena leptocephala]|nr:hypothetical protein B0H13DRAFT_2317833 [Mycena leptocephala]
MWENTLHLWNTVVKLKPEFTIPPSDPNPIHYFPTRSRSSVHNFGSSDSEQHSILWPPSLSKRIRLLLRGQKLPASPLIGEPAAALSMVEIPPVLGPLALLCMRTGISFAIKQANAFGGGWFNEFAQRFRKFTTNPISALQGIEESRTPMTFLRPLQLVKTGHSSLRRINGYGPYGGFPLGSSRKIGKDSYSSESARPEPSASTDSTMPACARATFEVDPSPIMEDVQNFPSLDSVYFSCVTSGTVGDNPDQNMMSDIYQEQEGQDDDARNFDHTNLSGSFVLQSTSCRDITGTARDSFATAESVPTLLLTFPTPKPRKPLNFVPQTVHKFVAATVSGESSSTLTGGHQSLNVPALPRCTVCGFGFGLDLHDLKVPLSSNPCRFCEPQWLACKLWYEARGKGLGERSAVRPAVDELGQLDDKQARSHAKTAYSRFSNVIMKDGTRTTKCTTKRTAATVWKKEPNRKDKDNSVLDPWIVSTCVMSNAEGTAIEAGTYARGTRRKAVSRIRGHLEADCSRTLYGIERSRSWEQKISLACGTSKEDVEQEKEHSRE